MVLSSTTLALRVQDMLVSSCREVDPLQLRRTLTTIVLVAGPLAAELRLETCFSRKKSILGSQFRIQDVLYAVLRRPWWNCRHGHIGFRRCCTPPLIILRLLAFIFRLLRLNTWNCALLLR
ncbi:unnamed protein product, partial [Amoebophrya sp. A120]|eukprot:GSA120T00004158001.1